MTALYPREASAAVVWHDFIGTARYIWASGTGWDVEPDATGNLWHAPTFFGSDAIGPDGLLNIGVTLDQAERTLRQLGHTIGEWDD